MLALTEKQSFLNRYGLSGNALKIIACLFMLADHIGFVFFPSGLLLRKIGRLALPIFAFLVAEGCKYTKNKPKHLLIFLVAGIIYLFAYLVVEGVLYGSILTTFTLSTLIIYSLQFLKKYLAKGNFKMAVLGLLCIAASIIFSVFVCRTITVDYGIAGVFLPVFVSLADLKDYKNLKISPQNLHMCELLLLACGICLVVYQRNLLSSVAPYHFLSLIFVALYSGRRGYANIKYFFHIFYPVHLVILYGVWYFLYVLN